MPSLPTTGASKYANPHVVIVGAGASRAACPDGDANGRRLPLMADLVDLVGLKPLLAKYGIESEETDFEAVFDGAVQSGYTELTGELERRVHHYFSQLVLPETATAYDYLLLSLRPKDLIATFNWDPLLAQAFRRHEGKIALPQLAFLHGNVAYGYCAEHRRCGWIDDHCTSCGKDFITRQHYIAADSIMKSYAAWHPRRSCDALAAATLMLQPWKDDWLPERESFEDLRAWVNPLWKEETRLAGTDQQFSGQLCSEHRKA